MAAAATPGAKRPADPARDPDSPPKRPRPNSLDLATVFGPRPTSPRPTSPGAPGSHWPQSPPRGQPGGGAPGEKARPASPALSEASSGPPTPDIPLSPGGAHAIDPDCSPGPPDPDPMWSASAIPNALPPHILAETFERHLRGLLRGVRSPLAIGPLWARLDYLCSLVVSLEAAGMVDRGLGRHLWRLTRRAPPSAAEAVAPRPLMGFYEAATQNQADCQLWALLRRGLTTASTLRWGAQGPCFSSQWLTHNASLRLDAQSSAVMFGRVNEPTARNLLFRYCVGRADAGVNDDADAGRFVFHQPGDLAEENVHACGVLMDGHTGMVGASLDILVCPRDPHGYLAPAPQTPLAFYEVKCRAKYAFDPADPGAPAASAYEDLMARRSPEAFRAFIRSIPNPGVRYFAPGRVPGPEEALVTQDRDWLDSRAAGEKRRCSAPDRALVELNSGVVSEVLLFGVPDLERRTISPVAWSSGELVRREPIFANPRHPNFKQILVQGYVLDSHFPDCPLQPHLVTFLGRHRAGAEEGVTFRLEDGRGAPAGRGGAPGPAKASILPDQAVPIALIITPVRVEPGIYRDIRRNSRLAFDDTLAKLWASRSPGRGPAAADTTSSSPTAGRSSR
uniref:Deoxyribonuclease n=1 Tax=Human herpesvirus 2 TaxID=10310 RepID=A0A1U9ZKX3_HHV2|nr:deoxyribonuclease [Human alphaherpesvirus 2]